jgi:3',5'-cyclic AMP phosphodiesterase CpdA
MPLSVLHISDLHRDPTNPIGNQALLHSLEKDRDHYTSSDPGIKPPNVIIVSGDIVQGVKHGTPNADAVLKRQYDEALKFLNALTDRFVDGDKARVVIVPGNHDVSDDKFRQSLSPIDTQSVAKKVIVAELMKPDSRVRWSWEDFGPYRVADEHLYEQRFSAFVDFYNAFYDGKRNYSTSPSEQFDVFDLTDLDICVFGFCSCHNNDLLNRQGAIHPDCIAEAGNRIRQMFRSRSPLLIAVWHHNTEGRPIDMDYMVPDIVKNLIDCGFSLGFHGHLHRPEFFDTRFRHGIERRITVISAGTLCGGAAFRFGRAYNLVEIDTAARTGRLHLREMQNDNLQMPIWGARSLPPNKVSYLDFTFDEPPRPFVKPDQITVLLNKAESLFTAGEFSEAARLLSPHFHDPLARRLVLESLRKLNDNAGIIRRFDPPADAGEVIALMDALWSEGMTQRLRDVLLLPLVANSGDGAVVEIRAKYKARLKA